MRLGGEEGKKGKRRKTSLRDRKIARYVSEWKIENGNCKYPCHNAG